MEKEISKDTELMEKLKDLARSGKNNNNFDAQKFTDLLKEYTCKNVEESTNKKSVISQQAI